MTRREKIILASALSFILIVIIVGAIFFFPTEGLQQASKQPIEYIRPPQILSEGEGKEEAEDEKAPENEAELVEEVLPERRGYPLSLIYGSDEEKETPPPLPEVVPPPLAVGAEPLIVSTQPVVSTESVVTPVSKEKSKREAVSVVQSVPSRSPTVPQTSVPVPVVPSTTSYHFTVPPSPEWYYWIQLVSSNHQETITRSREILRSLHMEAVVGVVYVGNERYYRLRLGPFFTRKEAHKFLEWLLQLEAFTEGYVIRTSSH